MFKLKNNRKLSKPLQKLNVFLDDKGFMRVGGRLYHSAFPYDKRHPYLLPRDHKLTWLITQQLHLKYFYADVVCTIFSLSEFLDFVS